MFLGNGLDIRFVDDCLEGKQDIMWGLEEYASSHVGITALMPRCLRGIEITDMACLSGRDKNIPNTFGVGLIRRLFEFRGEYGKTSDIFGIIKIYI